ncbi:low specificity L-threonine aldolase [Nitrospirillum amazonense]|uniref:threonine aldolase family protein n=1 Tax=Nitrospirillum amazonense TaxID=28077 RepID=UPI002DD435F9|nr:low specificity L-threonine aldolase [Nitrospirillum amazonense]MEC4590875.1 low specificity L-threonine aldolase [Nitrospirillum amazonense]
MNFMSDNVVGAAPEILAALAAANEGPQPSYGGDPLTARVTRDLAELFECDVTVFPVATGTAANALALSVLTPPYGAVYCHDEAHVQVDECGAPELMSGGAKLVPLAGPHGKLDAMALKAALDRGGAGVVHHVQPAALTLTQATESGTVYTPDEVMALTEVARTHKLRVHMDGARFANAVASLACAPADITWRAGVDVLSFGATKNGALAAEAVIFFDRALADSFAYRRKRAGHLFSKMRFLSAQLDAYLTDGLWLRLATHANAMATRLAQGLDALPGVSLRSPVQANEVFAVMPEPMIAGLEAAGFHFYRWDGACIRLVTAWNTDPAHVDAFVAAARGLAGIV